MNSVDTLPDLLHLNTLAHGVKVQLDLVPVPVCDQGVPDGYGDLPRDLASVSITWHDPRTQHDDRKYTGGPSLALGVAQVPISEQRARSVYESQDTQTYGLSLALTLTLPSSTVTTTSSSSLAAIVSFRLNSHASDATWLPTSKALLFTRSRAHAQSLALPFPPHTMSAVRIEFWPVTTCGGAAAAAQCLQATPEHVKMIALNHHSKAVPSAKAEHEGEADAYPSPASLLSSTHTSPAASQYAAFGGAQNASRVPPSPRVSHSGERQAWAHYSQARGQYYDDSDDSRNDYTAVTGSSNRHGQAVPDAAGSYDTTTNYSSRQDPPTLFPNSPSPSPSPWSQPNTKSRRAPHAAASHASSSSYHAPLPGVRHGRIAKPIPPPTSPSYKSYTASGIKQGDPPPSSPCCGAAAAAARLMRGMSVVYIASSGADHSKDAEGGAGAGTGRIRVAIIKTPVGMRDFVQEF